MPILFFSAGIIFAQNFDGGSDGMSRGSIPEELLRPRREEAPRYPIDLVIGSMGQGDASGEAYRFARETAAALLAGNMDAPALSAMNRVLLESYLSGIAVINPRSFRLGGGREEPDGSFSFLIRFTGREQGIAGELFVRFEERRAAPPAPREDSGGEQPADETAELPPRTDPASDTAPLLQAETEAMEPPARLVWVFEDLILEEPRNRETENGESKHRFDFPPYQRFF
ncbi:MAG: hypothetical protein LBD48_08515 [Treponema sp.]|nr:hypothetical protein [Treponema sp.]